MPDEDRQTLNTIVKASEMFRVMRHNQLVGTIIDAYSKAHPSKRAYLQHPDPRGAHIRDDPSALKWRLQVGPKTISFDDRNSLNLYVFTTLLADVEDWPDADREKVKQAIEHLTDDKYAEIRAMGAEDATPFDPHAADEASVSAHVDKFLKQFDDPDKGYWIHFEYDPPNFGLSFHKRGVPPRRLQFATVPAVDQWVRAHEAGIVQWARGTGRAHGDDARIRYAVRKLLDMLRRVLAGDADAEQMRQQVWELQDHIIASIGNQQVKELLMSISYSLGNAKMWEHLTDYHLTWLPERVRELLAKDVGA